MGTCGSSSLPRASFASCASLSAASQFWLGIAEICNRRAISERLTTSTDRGLILSALARAVGSRPL